jgi:diguanylate cyclase (GGDEF)-like protein/PAS domain S-box-containing protein
MVHDHQERLIDHPDPGRADASAEAAMYRMMVENTSDLIIRYDRNRIRTYVSPVAREMIGYEPEELIGRQGYDMNHPDDRERAIKSFHSIGPDQPRDKLTFRVQRKDGEYIWLETLFRYLPEDGGVISVSRDITARKHAEDLLAETNRKLEAANRLLRALAQQDGLTGLANRRCFDEVLHTEFRRASREQEWLGLVLIDVDYFKAYNDLYGHLAGDECLRRISAVIAQTLRRPADLAARYGGEELAVVLPATDQSGATGVAERICRAVSALRIEHRGNSEGIATVSAGATSDIPLSHGDDSPTRLIEAADQALYQAKRGGRNRVSSTIPSQREVQPA